MALIFENIEKKQTVPEEKVNSALHIFGALLAGIGLMVLVFLGLKQHSPVRLLAFFLYGASTLFLFSMSSIYHGIQRPGIKRLFEKLDYVGIYIMMAGSYSPILLIALRDYPLASWALFALVWTLAIAFSLVTLLFVRHVSIVNIAIYGIMGAMAFALIPAVYRTMGVWIILSASFGGLLYVVGVPFFLARFRYHHAVWHSLVLAGSIVHFFTVIFFLR